MNKEQIFAIERPHRKLLTLYIIRSFMLPPISLIAFPLLYFRYHTMRYRFDEEGISMSWGILFRKQVNLTYTRIQDIHLTSGIIQRWLGVADIHIQTASGSAAAEMTIEGLMEYEDLRDFLYTKMRGYKESQAAKSARASSGTSGESSAPPLPAMGSSPEELVNVMREIQREMRAARKAIESMAPQEEGGASDV